MLTRKLSTLQQANSTLTLVVGIVLGVVISSIVFPTPQCQCADIHSPPAVPLRQRCVAPTTGGASPDSTEGATEEEANPAPTARRPPPAKKNVRARTNPDDESSRKARDEEDSQPERRPMQQQQQQRKPAASGKHRGEPHVSPAMAFFQTGSDELWPRLLSMPGDVGRAGLIVEVGSFDGEQAAKALDRGFTTVVLEPSPPNLERMKGGALARHLAGNKLQLREAAASSKVGKLVFWIRGGSGDFASPDGKIPDGETRNYNSQIAKRVEVETVPLDDVVGERRVWIAKIDVQGHEMEVLRGADRLFSENRVAMAIIEFHPKRQGSETAVEMLHWLDARGYDLFFLGNMSITTAVFQDEWLASPQLAQSFVDSFSPYPMWGLGQFTDIVAVCRECVGVNMLSAAYNAAHPVSSVRRLPPPPKEPGEPAAAAAQSEQEDRPVRRRKRKAAVVQEVGSGNEDADEPPPRKRKVPKRKPTADPENE